MEDNTLSGLILQSGKKKVLDELLEDPGKEYSIKELSDESGASYDLTHRFVQVLSSLGIIEKRRAGGAVFVQLNQSSPYIEPLEEIIRIDTEPLLETAKRYAEELEEIESVLLFGSVARGTPRIDSDIDILVIVEDREEESERYANKLASKYEREDGVTIVPMVETMEEFQEDLETETPFVQELIKDAVVLKGENPW